MTQIIENHCLTCRRTADVFKVLSDDELKYINEHRVGIHYKAGEVIFKQGAPANFFVCITQGSVKLSLENQDFRNLIIGISKPVKYIYDPGIFTNEHHRLSAVALEPTNACLIDVKAMKEVLKRNSEFSHQFIIKISNQAIRLFERISSCTQKHVFGRVADTLLYLHPEIYPQNPMEVHLSRQDLADLSGMTKESLIRVLKKFKDDNILTLNGNVFELLDIEQLKEISRKG